MLEFLPWLCRARAPIPGCTQLPPISSNHSVEHGSHRARCAVALPMTTIARACQSGSASIAYCSNALPVVPRSMSSVHSAATGGLFRQPMLKRNSRAGMAASDGCLAGFARSGRRRALSPRRRRAFIWRRGVLADRIRRCATMIMCRSAGVPTSVSVPRCSPSSKPTPAS